MPVSRQPRSRLLEPLRSRRLWWAVLAAVLLLGGMLVWLRQPLADRLWPDTRIQQLLQQGDQALRQGRLSAADGSGARELFEAAQALDNDRPEPQAGLARTGQAALLQARAALAAGHLPAAAEALALARALEVPQADEQRLEAQLRRQRAHGAGLQALLARAGQARREGRLDGTADSALPLYQQVLQLAPERTAALEGREDALSELIQRAWQGLRQDDLEAAAPLLAAAGRYDPGHADLPAAQAELNRLVEVRRARAEQQLRRGQLDAAGKDFQALQRALPDDAQARDGLLRVATAWAAQASRDAADFRFDQAEAGLAQARALAPEAPALVQAEQALAKARQAHASQPAPLPAAERERRLRRLLARVAHAETAQDWLTPPGASAYDALREAQAIAPADPRVRRAVARIVAATRGCFEDELRGNRLRATRICLDAWQAMAARDAGLAPARRRLAQRWVAVGSEQLRAENLAVAQQALAEARQLDPAAPGLREFAAQVKAATR